MYHARLEYFDQAETLYEDPETLRGAQYQSSANGFLAIAGRLFALGTCKQDADLRV